jgi:hypothetical protein
MTEQQGFKRAKREQARLRMALDGPSGSGKTYTALIAAKALANGGTVALIDTEHGSASKYADEFVFDTLDLDNFHPQKYINALTLAEQGGYAVVVIDSLSHAWEGAGGILEMHDDASRKSGNSWTAWRDITPLHNKLIEAILSCRAHVIVTMRSKMEYQQTEQNGKKTIEKVGMAPIQRAGIEYEFDVVGDMDLAHNLIISKTRISLLDSARVNRPDSLWFVPLREWLTGGAVPEPKVAKPVVADPPANGKAAITWTTNKAFLAKFWPWTQEQGMTDAEVHEALGVEHLAEYAGTAQSARNTILAWLDNKAAPEEEKV